MLKNKQGGGCHPSMNGVHPCRLEYLQYNIGNYAYVSLKGHLIQNLH
jgi:hypothetical protein